MIAAIFAISLSGIPIVRHAAAAEAHQRSCWSASVASAKPGTASATGRLSSSPAKQIAAKAAGRGRWQAKRRHPRPLVFAVSADQPRRGSVFQSANMNCSLPPPCLPARHQSLPPHWRAAVRFGPIMERSSTISVAQVTAKGAPAAGPRGPSAHRLSVNLAKSILSARGAHRACG